MLVTLAAGNTVKQGNVRDFECEWRLTGSQQGGTARFVVERSSPLWTSALLPTTGGSLVHATHKDLGSWRGVCLPPTFDRSGSFATVEAADWTEVLNSHIVPRGRTYRNLTAGALARIAVKTSVGGLGAMATMLGTFVEGAPAFRSYTFNGEYAAVVLDDLAAKSGQEWSVNAQGLLTWGPVAGTYRGVLCEGGDLVDITRSADAAGRATEVLGRSSLGREKLARAAETAGDYWQRTIVVQASSEVWTTVGRAAVDELNRQRSSSVSIGASLSPQWWATVREGDTARLILPHAGFSQTAPLVRVVARRWREGSRYVTLTLAVVREFSTGMPKSYGAEVDRAIVVDYTYDAVRRVATLERLAR